MPALPPDAERRHDEDRLIAPKRRAPGPTHHGRLARWSLIGVRDVAIAVGALVAIVFAVRQTHPIYTTQPKVVQALSQKAPNVTRTLVGPTPADTSKVDSMVAAPQFERDRQAFAADLVATGRMTQARADSIAYYAVREAYVEGIPPAVVFGVMLTENAQFVSGAMSNVGAVGLMQIYPKVWLKELRARFGSDLASDSTNLKYGIYILKQYIKSDSGKVTPSNLSTGLLHYNGCVLGRNTPNCKTYPSKVKTYVEKQGSSLCAAHDFYDCIAKPFIAGLLGKESETQ